MIFCDREGWLQGPKELLGQQKNTIWKKEKVIWNEATGSIQVLKKGWGIPLMDGTSATEGNLSGSAHLAAVEGIYRAVDVFVLSGRKRAQ